MESMRKNVLPFYINTSTTAVEAVRGKNEWEGSSIIAKNSEISGAEDLRT
jgi:hypothetical protein